MTARYSLVAFDLYGTLLDISGMAREMSKILGRDATALLAAWRTAQLERTWAHNTAGTYEPFDRVTAAALDALAPDVDPAVREQLVEPWFTVPPHRDAAATLRTLAASGARTAVLSNGTEAMIRRALDAAELTVDHIRSVDELGVYKPDPRVYHLLDELAPTAATLFVSSNAFDAEGAKRAGCTVCFIDRGAAQPKVEPDLRVRSLAEIVAHVVG